VICIGDNVRLTVVQTGNHVALGFEAPPEVKIDRLEVRRAKEANGRAKKVAECTT